MQKTLAGRHTSRHGVSEQGLPETGASDEEHAGGGRDQLAEKARLGFNVESGPAVDIKPGSQHVG
jgi:hypothetical protein